MKKLGFGCMRLPMVGEEVDIPQFCKMVDRYLEEGFCYFDTAHGYINGKSETAIKAGLTSRYPREKYVLTDKLSGSFFSCREDIEPLFESQLEACGVEYFDYYLMHCMTADKYRRFRELGAFDEVTKLREQGRVRHMGISFHDSADVLEMILSESPEIEVVQIQFNYRDYEDPTVQARRCYEVCRKYGKPVFVMEPVRGGSLVGLPQAARDVLTDLGGGSIASYALRYCVSFEGMEMILSGMSNTEQMEDNLATMKEAKPLDEKEMAAIAQVVDILRHQNQIPCTGCEYCTERCPMNINIPRLFKMVNASREFTNYNPTGDFADATRNHAKPSECLGCGMCEEMCPQHIEIRKELAAIAEKLEK